MFPYLANPILENYQTITILIGMNRDTTILQVTWLFVVIAILGIAIFNKQSASSSWQQPNIQQVQEADTQQWPTDTNEVVVREEPWSLITNSFAERMNSPNTNLVKSYFAALARRDYTQACDLLSNDRCAWSRPGAVENFSRMFKNMVNWYEYVNIKDFGIVAPSWKQVVCVKYSYRLRNDANPWLISEIASFYLDQVDWSLRITDRVCEKFYKEWHGVRPCPLQANAIFCEGLIK